MARHTMDREQQSSEICGYEGRSMTWESEAEIHQWCSEESSAKIYLHCLGKEQIRRVKSELINLSHTSR